MIKPKYFIVKRDEKNPLWKEYIKWLNKTFNKEWIGTLWDYYGYDGILETIAYNNVSDFKNNAKLLTLEQWKELFIDDFSLPEKWCVKSDETKIDILGNFWGKHCSRVYEGEYTKNSQKNNYFYSHNLHSGNSMFSSAPGSNFNDKKVKEEFTEITWEQFLKYVLKEEEKEIKNIFGYKAPYDLFGGRIKKGDIFSEYSDNKFVMYNRNHKTSGVAREIVENWEPVYGNTFRVGDWIIEPTSAKADKIVEITEKFYKTLSSLNDKNILGFEKNNSNLRLATAEEIEASQEIKIGEYKVEIGKCVKINGIIYEFEELQSLIKLMKKDQVKSLNVGCNSQYKVDLKLLEKIFSRIKP